MTNWKDNASVLLLSEILKKTKDKNVAKILIEARKDFVNIRTKQEKKFGSFYLDLFNRIFSYLVGKKTLTSKNYKELTNIVNGFFKLIIANELYEIKNNMALSLKASSNVGTKYLKQIFKMAKVNLTNELREKFELIILKETNKSFDLVIDYAWGKKKTTLSKKIHNANQRSRKGIINILKYYQDNNINDPRILSKDLEGYLKRNTLVSKRLKKLIPGLPKDCSYEALRVARSEINQAFTQNLYNVSQQTYGYEGIYWVLSSRHPEFDICTIYANTKRFGKKGFFPKGKEPRVPHPNCICTQIASFGDINKTVNDLIKWSKNPKSNKKMDEYIKTLNRKAGQL
jgi:hypothetical protein